MTGDQAWTACRGAECLEVGGEGFGADKEGIFSAGELHKAVSTHGFVDDFRAARLETVVKFDDEHVGFF